MNYLYCICLGIFLNFSCILCFLFIKLFKNENGKYESMVQRVYRQIQTVNSDMEVTIATSKSQVSAIRNQLGNKVSICLEPCRRDTFPAIALAAAYLKDVQGLSDEDCVAVCPVDPYVDNTYYQTVQKLEEIVYEGQSNLVLMGIEPYHLWKDENNYSAGDVKDDIPFQPDLEQQEVVFNAFVKRYPNLKCIARHVRYSPSCSENSLKAYLWYEGKTYESRKLTFNILDRVGGGDAFVSGVIYALMQKFTPEDTVNFGVASSAIKHTLHGDGNITDDVSLIRHVMQMNFDIKR